MSTAVLQKFNFNIKELRQIQRRTPSPSRFGTLGKELCRAAKLIKRDWKSYSPDQKITLQEFAYDLLESPTGAKSIRLRIRTGLYMLFVKATGQEKEFFFCLDAMDRLIDNILDAVERDDSSYEQVLSDTLKELNDNPESGEPIDANTRGGWLRRLSDKAISEV